MDCKGKKEIAFDEMKCISREILADFDHVCRKNKLKYSIAYGTLLDAVRHGGYIPWDDDIDVIMPRPDYEKFAHVYCQELASEHRLISIDVDKSYMSTS